MTQTEKDNLATLAIVTNSVQTSHINLAVEKISQQHFNQADIQIIHVQSL
jgi:hypothetical protein